MRFHPAIVAFVFLLSLAEASWLLAERPVASRDAGFLIGADVSALPVYERAGVVYKAAKHEWDALPLLRRVGINTFRLRLFVKPDGEGLVTNDLDYTVSLARRAKATGARLLLDIHYSDTWADPSKQTKPSAWEKLSQDALAAEVRSYTESVLRRFSDAGVAPELVQVGNEISNGLLWPEGKVEFGVPGGDAGWPRFFLFYNAGVSAVRSVLPGAKVYLHLACTGNLPQTRWFLEHVKNNGVALDAVGFSYYPEWHGGISDLKGTLEMAAAEFPWPVLVLETAYPYKHDTHFDGRPHQEYPQTPEGQAAFLKAVTKVVRDVPKNRGLGVFYWQPEAVVNPNVDTWLGGSCSLFDDHGQLLPGAGFGLEEGTPSASKP